MKARIDCTEAEIARLKVPYQRQVMLLRLQGLERWKIAEQLGRTEDSVKRAITQARVAMGLRSRPRVRSDNDYGSRPYLLSHVVMLMNFGLTLIAAGKVIGRSKNTMRRALKCAEREAGCTLVERPGIGSPVRSRRGRPADGPAVEVSTSAGRCACGLLLPCDPETCPAVNGAVGFMRGHEGNLAREMGSAGGTGTHQGRRRAA